MALADAPAEIALQAPPALPRPTRGGSLQLFLMVPMMLAMGAMSFVYIGQSGGPMTVVFGVLFVVVMGGMLVGGMSRGGMGKQAQINDERRDYLRYLAGLRGRLHAAADAQRELAVWMLPEPADLWALAGTCRRWERRPVDPAFGRVRVGRGPQRLATTLRPPQTAPLEDLDPVSSTSLKHLLRA
jgi:DNA segregation ATPase FtsK/SpoIIIE, S-DNA-T family